MIYHQRKLHQVTYAKGQISGFYSEDTVSVAGLTVKKQQFVEVTNQTSIPNADFDVIPTVKCSTKLAVDPRPNIVYGSCKDMYDDCES